MSPLLQDLGKAETLGSAAPYGILVDKRAMPRGFISLREGRESQM